MRMTTWVMVVHVRWRDDHETDRERGVVDPEHGNKTADDKEDDLSEDKDPGADRWEETLAYGC